MHGAGARQDALGKGVGLGVGVEDPGLDGGLRHRDAAHDEDDGRGDAERDEGELPVRDKGDDKGRDKGGEPLKGEAKLFRDAALNEAAVVGGLRGDGPGRAAVEKGHLLVERGAEVRGAEVADDAVRGIGQEGVVEVGEGESGDAEIDEVETVFDKLLLACVMYPNQGWGYNNVREPAGFASEMRGRRFAIGEIGHGRDKGAKDEVLQGDAGAGANGGDNGDALERVLERGGIGKDSLTMD